MQRLSLAGRSLRCIGNENGKKTAKPKIGAHSEAKGGMCARAPFMSDPWGLVSLNLYSLSLRLFPNSTDTLQPNKKKKKIDIYNLAKGNFQGDQL